MAEYESPLFQSSEHSEQRRKEDQAALDPIQFTPWQSATTNIYGGESIIRRGKDAFNKYMGYLGNTRTLTPEELQTEWGVTSDVPLKEGQARAMYQAQQRKAYMNAVQSRVDPNAAAHVFLPFMGNIIGSYGLAEFGIDVLIGKGLGIGYRAATSAKLSIKAAQTAARLKKAYDSSRLVRTGVGGLRGAVSGTMEGFVDAEISRAFAKELGTEFTDNDYNNTVFFGGVFGTGMGTIGGVFSKNADLQYKGRAYADGKVPKDVAHYKAARDANDFGNTRGPGGNMPPGSTSGKFYSVHRSEGGNFSFGSQDAMGTKFGEGIVATSNRDVALSLANSPFNGKGQLVELELSGLNLLDVNKPLDLKVQEALLQKLNNNGIPKEVLQEALEGTGSIGKFVDLLEEVESKSGRDFGIRKALEDVTKENGFDGYRYEHNLSTGESAGVGEGVHVFDPSKVTARDVTNFDGIEEIEQGLRDVDNSKSLREELEYYDSPESDIFYDEVAMRSFEEEPPPLPRNGEVDLRRVDDVTVSREAELELLREANELANLTDLEFAIEEFSEVFVADSADILDAMVDVTSLSVAGFTRKIRDLLEGEGEGITGAKVEAIAENLKGRNLLTGNNLIHDVLEDYFEIPRTNGVSEVPSIHESFQRDLLLYIAEASGSDTAFNLLDDMPVLVTAPVTFDVFKTEVVPTNDISGFMRLDTSLHLAISSDKEIRGLKVVSRGPKAASFNEIGIVEDGKLIAAVGWDHSSINYLTGSKNTKPMDVPSLIKIAIKDYDAPLVASGDISEKAARLTNLLATKEMKRVIRKEINGTLDAYDKKIKNAIPPEKYREVAKGMEFCKRTT